MKTQMDPELAQRVAKQLRKHPSLENSQIAVIVDSGIVTLTGHVTDYAAKTAAADAAHLVAGVRDVANDLKVKVPGAMPRSSSEIAGSVRQALESDPGIPSDRIISTVVEGWVVLEGSVQSPEDRDAAEQAVRTVVGVPCTNRIRVNPAPVDRCVRLPITGVAIQNAG